jgi:Glycosyl hydrolases family 43/Carbohydrate binding module (family 6)
MRKRQLLVAAWAVLIGLFISRECFAVNPFLPSWEYIPDGEPRVFGDRVYLYGSHDRAGSHRFCDYILKVWSAPLNDLNNWRDEGIAFSTRTVGGHAADVPWSDHELYAPDVVQKDGKYYLYFYVFGDPAGVAVSDSPAGPFKLLSKLVAPPGSPPEFGGWRDTYPDPGVLVDDDGKVYIYWGFQRSHMAQIDPQNMYQILPGTYQADIIPKDKPFKFFEAASPRKINGTYYMIYADGGILTYATSKSPTGPFAYGGHIIGNGRDYPGGNNHGSLCQINGQWYIFYHRMTNNTVYSRKACVERVTIEADGSIKEVEQTSLGFQESLDPFQTTPAEIACVLKGGNCITEIDPFTLAVIRNKNGCVIGFKYFDFGRGVVGQNMELAVQLRGSAAATMEVWIDSDSAEKGTKIGTLEIPATDDGNAWRVLGTPVSNVTGRHAVLFRLAGGPEGQSLCDVRSFRFVKSEAKPASTQPSH